MSGEVGERRVTADGHGVSSWGDEKVLELVVMVEHLGEFSWPSISAGSVSLYTERSLFRT